MFVVTQGYLTTLVIVQGYGTGTTPIPPAPPVADNRVFGGGIQGGGKRQKIRDKLKQDEEDFQDMALIAIALSESDW